jgi:hypothetical protein
MTKSAIRKGILALPLKERLALVKAFDRALVESDVARIPASHVLHLDEVMEEYERHPSATVSHGEMREHLKRLKRRLAGKRASKTA